MLASINGLFRLTRDVEMHFSSSNAAILKLGLVCSEKYGDKETVLYLDATVFGKMAETINNYAGSKGTQLYIRGKLQTEMWTSQDGQKHSKNSMIIEGFDFVSKRTDTKGKTASHNEPAKQQSQTNESGAYIPQGAGQAQANYQASLPEHQSYDIDEGMIPF